MLRDFSLPMLAVTFGALLAVSACSSSDATADNDLTSSGHDAGVDADGASNGPTGTPLSINEYCTARANLDAAWCAYADKCCSADDKEDVMFAPPGCLLGPTDPKTCIDRLTKQTGDGSVAFHGEFAQACIGELQKWVPAPPSTCSGVHFSDHVLTGHAMPALVQIEACRQTEQGQSKIGTSCEYDSQCAEGLRCRSATGPSGDYQCQPLSKRFEPCALQSDCDAGLTCIGELNAKTCDTLHGVGQPCTFANDCQDGLLCGGDTCVTPPPAGGSCSSDNGFACEPLLACSFDSHTCIRLGGDGAPCTTSGDCEGRCDKTAKKCTSICGGTW